VIRDEDPEILDFERASALAARFCVDAETVALERERVFANPFPSPFPCPCPTVRFMRESVSSIRRCLPPPPP
jgi:hypothetical protein